MDSPPAAPRPRRRWLRRLIVTTAVVVVALLVATWFAPQVIAGTALRDRVIAAAGGSIDGTLAVDTMALGWFSPVEMRGVSVTDTAGRKVIDAEAVHTTKTLWRLALAGGDYGTVTVDKPVVHVVLEGDTTNLEQVLAKYLKDDGTPKKEHRTGLTLQVNNGRVIVTDAAHPGEHVLDAVSATVTMPRPRSEPITVSAKANAPDPSTPGSVSADASVGAETTASVVAHDLPLAAFEPLVRRLAPGTTAAGRLEADMKLARTGGDAPVTTLTGTAAIAGLDAGGPWARGDRVRLDRVSLNAGRVSLDAGVLKLHDTTVKCDAGHLIATAEISTKDPVGELFTTPGLAVSVDIDAAKLAGVAPRLLRIRPGTALTDGKLKAEITSKKGDAGTQWAGTVDASALRGTRDGKPVVWEKPLHAAFAGHLRSDDELPVFDKLTCEADFVGLAGRGSVERFLIEANLDLNRLAERLADFVDLGGMTLGGTGAVTIKVDPAPGGGFTAGLSARVLNFRYSEPGGDSVTEPEVTATAAAAGRRGKGQPFRVDAFQARVLAGADQFAVRLAEPIADLKTSRSGKAEVGLTGDLARWRGRAGRFAPVPDTWIIAGTGPVVATVALTPAGVTVEKATANLTNAKFDGAGVLLDEPTLKLETGMTWERASGNITLTDVIVHGPTLVLTTPKVSVTRTHAGRAVATTAKVTDANLSRVTRMLKLNLSPSSIIIGTAAGTVTLNVDGPATGFDTDFVVDDFRYGNPAKPLWREPKLVLKAKGTYDPAADALTLPALTVGGTGLTVTGNATLAQLSGAKQFDAAGTLGYDLAKLEPQLKEMLGASATARGTGQKPFRATAPLGGPDPLAALAAQAGLSWEYVKAYGFDVGPAEMTATATAGKLTFTPITAAFGAGGTVRVEPTIDLTSPGYDLSVKPGQIVDRTKLTPEACASALGYALPAFAGAARATGEASFRVDESRIPLTDVQHGTVKGLLTVHTADVSAGPMVSKIAELLGVQQTSMTLSKEQQVPVRLENGRVYHEKFTINLGQTQVVSSGSVGLDQTVSVTLDMPVPPKLIDAALARNPAIRDSLSRQRIKVPVGGTLKQPRLDEGAARAAIADVAKNVTRDVLGGAKDKFLDKLGGELQKKLPLGPKKP